MRINEWINKHGLRIWILSIPMGFQCEFVKCAYGFAKTL